MQGSERRILNYRLYEELGYDRLGRVFRAEAANSGQTVIVRLLRVAGVVAPDRVAPVRRWLRERIRTAATVSHPNVVRVLDFVPYRDLDVLALEDVRGETLAEWSVRGHSDPADDALRFAIEIAGAVAAAHARQVPHGRITVENIRIGRDGVAHVLDLGIPRPSEAALHRAERWDAETLATACRHDVHALGRVLEVLLNWSGGALALHGAKKPLGIRGTAWSLVSDALSDGHGTAGVIHSALLHVARSTTVHEADSEKWRRVIPAERFDPPAREMSAASAGPRREAGHRVLAGREEPDDFSPIENEPVPLRASQPEPPKGTARVKLFGVETEFDRSHSRTTIGLIFDVEGRSRRRHSRKHRWRSWRRITGALRRGPIGTRNGRGKGGKRRARRRAIQFAAASLLGAVLVIGTTGLLRRESAPSANAAPSQADSSEILSDAQPAEERAAEEGSPSSQNEAVVPANSGSLEVNVEPPGARVSIDGGSWQPGPATFRGLTPERHRVQIALPGYVPRTDTVTVLAGGTTRRSYVLVPQQ
jgi:hypothetical protein